AGRQQEYLVSATGRRISLTAFNMHDAVFDDLYAVQFCQEQRGLAEFRYVAGPRFHGSRLTRIEESIRRKLGDDFQITFREVKEVDKTARGKHRWLVSQLPGNSRHLLRNSLKRDQFALGPAESTARRIKHFISQLLGRFWPRRC